MSIITLLTDFGVSSPYVAQMKGVIATREPGARIVDLTHSIPPQDVLAGAITLDDLVPWFPADTVHVAVVDPGVGSDRQILAAAIGQAFFVLPDNGLISSVAERFDVKEVVALDRPEFWLSPVSKTFHGRDIMSPVAGAISRGISLGNLGTHVTSWNSIDIPRPQIAADMIDGEVIFVDSFGNLVTNIWASVLEDVDTLTIGNRKVSGLVGSYSQRRPGELVALVGSAGRLEFAITDGNAAKQLDAAVGTKVRVDRSPPNSRAGGQ